MPQLMLIDGRRVPSASGETIEVQDPATEEVIDHAPMGSEQDARAAIALRASSSLPIGTRSIVASVAGSWTSNVSPVTLGTRSPPMSIS